MDRIADKEEQIEVHDPRDDEAPVVPWIPLAVPLLAVLLLVCVFLIEADVL